MIEIATEEWRPVVGWPGYEVSTKGRVRSVDRTVMRSNGVPNRVKGRILSQSTHPERGYKQVVLYRTSREKRTFTVHTLVLEGFVGTRPDGMEGRHLDGDPANNSLRNLLWGTRQENRADMARHGHDHNANKTECPHGHRYDENNTYRPPNRNARVCKTCNGWAVPA